MLNFNPGDNVIYIGNARPKLRGRSLTIDRYYSNKEFIEVKEESGFFPAKDFLHEKFQFRIFDSKPDKHENYVSVGYQVESFTLSDDSEHSCQEHLKAYRGLKEAFEYCTICDKKF